MPFYKVQFFSIDCTVFSIDMYFYFIVNYVVFCAMALKELITFNNKKTAFYGT